jgi:hypothetical protein
MSHRRLALRFVPLALLGLALVTTAQSSAAAVQAPGRALRAARFEMIQARKEVEEKRFERARREVIRDLDAAIAETERALREAKVPFEYEPPKDIRYEREFPHLHRAVVELREARTELKEERFGPERERRKSIEAIDAAIARLEDAIKLIR